MECVFRIIVLSAISESPSVQNEGYVGEALRSSSVPRDQIWLTSKVCSPILLTDLFIKFNFIAVE